MVFRDFRTYTETADPLGANRISGVDRRNHHRDDYANENKVKPVKKTIKALTDEIIKTLPDEVLWNTGRIIRHGINTEKLTASEKAWLKRHTRSIRTRLNEIVRERSNTYQAAVDSGAAFKLKGGEYDVFHPIPYPNPSELDHRERVSPFFTAGQWRLFANPSEVAVGEVLSDKVKSINSARLAADLNTEADQEAASPLSAPEEISPISSIDVASAPPADAVIVHHRHVAPITAPVPAPARPLAPTGHIAPASPAPTPTPVSDIQLISEPIPVPAVSTLTAAEVSADSEPEPDYQQFTAWRSVPDIVDGFDFAAEPPPLPVLAKTPPMTVLYVPSKPVSGFRQRRGVRFLTLASMFFLATALGSWRFDPIMALSTFWDQGIAPIATWANKEKPLEAATVEATYSLLWTQAFDSSVTQEDLSLTAAALLNHEIDHWVARGNQTLGYGCLMRGRYNEALRYLDLAIPVLSKRQALNDLALAYLGKTWANVYLLDPDHAELNLIEAQALNSKHEIDVTLWTGVVAFTQGDLDRAIKYTESALIAARLEGNKNLEADALNKLGLYHAVADDLETSWRYLDQGKALSVRIGYPLKGSANVIGWYHWAVASGYETDHIIEQLDDFGFFDAKETHRVYLFYASQLRRPHADTK